MRNWVYWVNSRAKNFDMLRSIWFANMDCMVNNVQYLHDDSDEHKQSNVTNITDKPYEPKFSDKQIHQCSIYANRICNCADGTDCVDGYDSDDPIVNVDRIYDTKRFFNEHIYEFDELHNELAREEGCIKGCSDPEGKRDCTWLRNRNEHATFESRDESTTTTDSRIH